MNYILERYHLILSSYDFSYAPLEAVLCAVLLSALISVLPLRQPLLWSVIAYISRFFYTKLNRKNRSKKARRVRGFLVTVFFLASAFFILRFILRLESFLALSAEHLFVFEVALLTLFISTGFVWKNLYQSTKKLALKKSTTDNLSSLVQEDIDKKDLHAQARLWIAFTAKSFERFFVSPIFYYLLFGLYGLALTATLSALKFSCSFKNENSKNFAFLINALDGVVHFIPARLAALLTLLASLLAKGCSFLKALHVVSKQGSLMNGVNTGWTIAVYAGALGITLGGPALQEKQSSDQPWIGEKNTTARIKEEALKKALLLHLTSLLLSCGLLLCLLFFFSGFLSNHIFAG